MHRHAVCVDDRGPRRRTTHRFTFDAEAFFIDADAAVFVVLCCLHDPPAKQRSDVLHWLRLIASKCGRNPRVILAGSSRLTP